MDITKRELEQLVGYDVADHEYASVVAAYNRREDMSRADAAELWSLLYGGVKAAERRHRGCGVDAYGIQLVYASPHVGDTVDVLGQRFCFEWWHELCRVTVSELDTATGAVARCLGVWVGYRDGRGLGGLRRIPGAEWGCVTRDAR